jgi:hypothetical protein
LKTMEAADQRFRKRVALTWGVCFQLFVKWPLVPRMRAGLGTRLGTSRARAIKGLMAP